MMPAEIIKVENLVRSYGSLVAVKGVSFAVQEGEIFGFLGPNGAGKTTTINILCTLLRPTSGSATVNGYDVTRQRSQVRRSIGLVFQDTTLDEYLTAEDNLRFHAYAYGIPGHERRRRMEELLTLVELWDRRKETVRSYSGGMKRRLELARGLMHSPRVLFLDEPTLGLDPRTRRRIWEHVLELRDRGGLTIFMTTHYMDEAEHCDRIAILDRGRIIALDTPDNLKDAAHGDVVTLKTEDNELAAQELGRIFGVSAQIQNESVSFVIPRAEEFLPRLFRELERPILSISVRRPTLDDVFLKMTGYAMSDQEYDEGA